MKPKGFLAFTLLWGLFFLSVLKSFDVNSIVTTMLGLGLTALFWFGFKWARYIILFFGFLCIAGGFEALIFDFDRPDPFTLFDRISLWLKVMLGAFSLYWLNTAKVKRYFLIRQNKGKPAKPVMMQPIPPVAEPR